MEPANLPYVGLRYVGPVLPLASAPQPGRYARSSSGHLNRRWTMAHMTKIQQLAGDGFGIVKIAVVMETTPETLAELARRNGFDINGMKGY